MATILIVDYGYNITNQFHFRTNIELDPSKIGNIVYISDIKAKLAFEKDDATLRDIPHFAVTLDRITPAELLSNTTYIITKPIPLTIFRKKYQLYP